MAFFNTHFAIPSDETHPRVHSRIEQDAFLLSPGDINECADKQIEFKKCVAATHAHFPVRKYYRVNEDHCIYYLNHFKNC